MNHIYALYAGGKIKSALEKFLTKKSVLIEGFVLCTLKTHKKTEIVVCSISKALYAGGKKNLHFKIFLQKKVF